MRQDREKKKRRMIREGKVEEGQTFEPEQKYGRLRSESTQKQ